MKHWSINPSKTSRMIKSSSKNIYSSVHKFTQISGQDNQLTSKNSQISKFNYIQGHRERNGSAEPTKSKFVAKSKRHVFLTK